MSDYHARSEDVRVEVDRSIQERNQMEQLRAAFQEYMNEHFNGKVWPLPEVEPHWYNKIILPVDPREMQTESADHITNVVLPEFLRHFYKKNGDYGDNHRTGLGVRAEFVGLHRKLLKLQRAVWDGEELAGEQPKELLWDLMGSCLLMLDLLAQQETDEERPW